VPDQPARLNEITARFREAGLELRFYESMPGAWDAIWHKHHSAHGIGRTDSKTGTTTGATLIEAAEAALARLEQMAPPVTEG